MQEKQKSEDINMKYLPEELKKEYDFYTKNNPDLEGIEHPLINLSDTFRAYFILLHYFTDASSPEGTEKMLFGIRSEHLLASAIGRQVVAYGGYVRYKEPLDICATLFFGLVKNHSFSDGNKRTALLILLYQLQLFGYNPTAPKKDFEKLVLSVAEGSVEQEYQLYYRKFKGHDDPVIKTISYALKRMTTKKDNTYHVAPTMREFCIALENQGVAYVQENGKIKFSHKRKGVWYQLTPEEKNFSIPFGGWTRVIGPRTARDTLRALDLYDQFASYKDLLEGADPLYKLTDDFKEPLRRLKDK